MSSFPAYSMYDSEDETDDFGSQMAGSRMVAGTILGGALPARDKKKADAVLTAIFESIANIEDKINNELRDTYAERLPPGVVRNFVLPVEKEIKKLTEYREKLENALNSVKQKRKSNAYSAYIQQHWGKRIPKKTDAEYADFQKVLNAYKKQPKQPKQRNAKPDSELTPYQQFVRKFGGIPKKQVKSAKTGKMVVNPKYKQFIAAKEEFMKNKQAKEEVEDEVEGGLYPRRSKRV